MVHFTESHESANQRFNLFIMNEYELDVGKHQFDIGIKAMRQLSSMLNGLARSLSLKKGKNSSESVAEEMAKEATRKDLILRSSGTLHAHGSENLASVFSKRGEKGMNQDCCIVWEEFGCQEDMMFCGIFDGHGQWGHYVAKTVRDSMPASLLCNWQHSLSESDPEKVDQQSFDIWKRSYLTTCAAIDKQLEQHRRIDAFHSGTTALSVVRQGDSIFIANVGDSRAVLATTSDDGSLVALQLSVDFKPNLPEEAERIIQNKGRVFCLDDEPGVYRVWLPDEDSPGLAMSRAFGDHCVKDFGLISVPEVTQRNISAQDRFIILASDGVWDVVSNQEAVEIVCSAADKAKSAKCLVNFAVRAWRQKRRNFAADDISAICLFFHSPSPTLAVRAASDK